jgi:hypothetical protein
MAIKTDSLCEREHITHDDVVAELITLLAKCDQHELLFHECLDEAEAEFLREVDQGDST